MKIFASLAWCLLVVFSLTSDSPAQAPWKIASARVKITPEKPLWMSGYAARTRPAEGTLHDLWAKVLVLEVSAGGRAVVITTDVAGFPKSLADQICGDLQAQCGLDRSRIMLTSSHTHCGPVLEGDAYEVYVMDAGQPALIAQYSQALRKKIVAMVAEACSRLVPGTLWAGVGTADFAVNRRNNAEKTLGEALARGEKPKGPVDHDVPVLAARDPAGNLLAVAFGYACHNTTLGIQQWCGDYAGFAQLGLEQRHPGVTALFHMGCGADQNPLPRRTVELCQQYGTRLAAGVDAVLARPMRPLAARLQTRFEILDLPYGEQPTAAELRELVAKPGPTNYQKRWAERLLSELEAGQTFAKSYPYPIQVWKLGEDQLWIVLGSEVVVDYALRLKKQYGPATWVTSYANDVMCYIPSHRVWQEGGYEAGAFATSGLPANRWCEDIETRIFSCVERLAK
ncbi:MAG: hypothetical protein GX575_13160 [Candidatus Anammoximicrobium sp.]|nr:hypothetical protein [Candidatus Anammoximicrobium sp.]